MSKWIVVCFMLACFAVSDPARAQDYFTGTEIYSACSGSIGVKKKLCSIWIFGFVEGVYSSQMLAERKNQKTTICLPNNITVQQAALVVEKYMREHPERLHLPAWQVASSALEDVFPCKE